MRIKFLFFLIIIFPLQVFAQNDWIRVQSDNGEFSIEIPSKYHLFFSKDGYQQSDGKGTSYGLKNIELLNSFIDKTLLSFEIYEGKKEVLSIFYEEDKNAAVYNTKDNKGEFSEKILSNNVNELTIKYNDLFIIKRYFASKKKIYVLTALSRDVETPVMKRFFDSVILIPDSTQPSPNGGQVVSSLQTSAIEIVTKNVKPYKSDKNNNAIDPSVKPLKIAIKPRASYVDDARMNQIKGTITLVCTFTEGGFISKIGFVNLLPGGLNRQVLHAVLRIKFLPEEKDGKPITSQRNVVYTFTLY